MEVRNKRNENQTHPTSRIPNSSFAAAARYNNDNSDFRIFSCFFCCFCYLRGLHGQSNQRAGRAKSSRAQRSPRLFHNHASKYITHHKLEMMFFSFSMLVVVLVSIFVTVLQMQILVLGCQRTQFHWILLLNGLMLDNPLSCIDSLHHCIIHFSQSKLVVVNLCDHLQRYLKSKDNKFLNLVFCWIRLKQAGGIFSSRQELFMLTYDALLSTYFNFHSAHLSNFHSAEPFKFSLSRTF